MIVSAVPADRRKHVEEATGPLYAKHWGTCHLCRQPIRPGAEIEVQGTSLWHPAGEFIRHADCEIYHTDDQDNEDPRLLRGPQCPSCHLTMPLTGQCDCEA